MKSVYVSVPILLLIFFMILGVSTRQQLAGGVTSLLPNPALTPGVINPGITQANIQDTICKSGWTATIRPPVSYTNKLKVQQISEYGYADTNPKDYELDHLLSLELGGNPTDPKNLWPEPYNTKVGNQTIGAHQKDLVENHLHALVCAKQLTLAEAQAEITKDWYAVYKTMQPTYGALNGLYDPDDE